MEHDPVYTFGLRQREFEREGEKLRRLGADVVKVASATIKLFLYDHVFLYRFVVEV